MKEERLVEELVAGIVDSGSSGQGGSGQGTVGRKNRGSGGSGRQSRLNEPKKEQVKKTIEKMKKLSVALKRVVYGRDSLVNALVLSIACNQHILIIGAHGEAKTLIAKKLCEFTGLKGFITQLHQEMELKSIVGMIDPIAYGKGEYGLIKTGFWDANILFFDEFLRGRSEFNDFLLEVMQERVCSKTILGEVKLPLVSVICTSNPLTEDYNTEQMDVALKDRFLIILDIDHLVRTSPLQIKRILDKHDENKLFNRVGKLTPEELFVIPRYARAHVKVNTAIIRDLFDELQKNDFVFSTRFIKRFKETLQVFCLLNGQGEARPKDYYDVAYIMLNNRLDGLTASKIKDAVSEALACIEYEDFNKELDRLRRKSGYKYVIEFIELAEKNKNIIGSLPDKLDRKWANAKKMFKVEFNISTKEVARDYVLLKKMQTEAFRECLERLAELRLVKTAYLNEAKTKRFQEILKKIDPKNEFFHVDTTKQSHDQKVTYQFWVLPKIDVPESFEKIKTLRLKSKKYLVKY